MYDITDMMRPSLGAITVPLIGLVPINGEEGWHGSYRPYLEDDECSLFSVVVNVVDSKDALGRYWLNTILLELFTRFLHNLSTSFYHTSRQVTLNIWVGRDKLV